MLAKYWKKIALVIAIVACLFNITSKIVKKVPFENEIISTVDDYVKVVDDDEKISK